MSVNSSKTPDITLYTDQTPNGIKISITLEELGLPYKTERVDISTDRQKEQWFLDKVNPNGKIPGLTDTFTDGKKICLFESGSIMQYLVEQYDLRHLISFPKGSRESYEVNNWLFFLNASVGPMQGQANHFFRYAPEKIQYGIDRYQNETRRLYRVLDQHLAKSPTGYLVGDRCTVADIAHWGWIAAAGWAGVDIDEFPNLKAWEDRMAKRSGVEKGRHVPVPHKVKEVLKNKEETEKHAKQAAEWVQRGQAQDAKK